MLTPSPRRRGHGGSNVRAAQGDRARAASDVEMQIEGGGEDLPVLQSLSAATFDLVRDDPQAPTTGEAAVQRRPADLGLLVAWCRVP
jgi:hypothetical protein